MFKTIRPLICSLSTGPKATVRYRRAVPGGVHLAPALGAPIIVRTNDRRRMLILDDFQGSCLAEMIFRSDILTIACTREWIAVVLVDEVYLYDFNVLATPLYRALTFHNPTGAIAINTDRVLACPG